MKLTYEKASLEDIESIFKENKEVLDQYEKIDKDSYNNILTMLQAKIESNIDEYKVVFCNGQKAGYFRTHFHSEMMEFDDLYIFSEFRNQQIGTKIMRKCCEEAGLPVILYVFARNVGAVSLYERLGFRIIENINDKVYLMKLDN